MDFTFPTSRLAVALRAMVKSLKGIVKETLAVGT